MKNKIFASTLLRIKIWKKREIKNVFFLTMTERTIIGRSNFVGTRTEETIIFTKKKQKSPAKDDECFCFLNYYTAKSVEKRDWVCCQKCNIWYHEICVGAKGKRQFICGR